MPIEHDEYTRQAVPDSARGSAWVVFFIVAGTQCGLPGFVLSAQIVAALGLSHAVAAIMAGTLMTAFLASLTSFLGASTGLSLALLSEKAFGSVGAGLVKILIAISLVGWFAATIGLLGTTASAALHEQFGFSFPARLIAAVAGAAIITFTLLGARGLERLGVIVIPAALLAIILALAYTLPRLATSAARPDGAMDFGATVSALVGSYVVGIIIQPDYSRYVRSPRRAVLATAVALGIVFPLLTISAGLPAYIMGRANLVSVLTALGLGVPALVVLTLSAWIDASACLYSGSLSIANQLRLRRMGPCVIAAGAAGIAMELSGIADLYIRFLVTLGVALPPVAAIMIVDGFLYRNAPETASPGLRVTPLLAWLAGIVAGILSETGKATLTTIPTFDSLLAAGIVALCGASIGNRLRRTQAETTVPKL